MNKLLLVDGSNLLFQMFFGIPARIVNADGKAIQGTLGFVGALLKIIRMTVPTHIAVLFDGEHSNERAAINADYKANRPDYSQTPEEETPFSQLPDIYAALDWMKIRYAETTECETDDWMASYAKMASADLHVVLSSFDSDFFQLVSDHVSVLRYRGEKTICCTPDWVKQKFGIMPSLYADFKSLTGDPADNIKGAELVGPKTAAALLNQYGSLDQILTHANEISKPALRQSLLRNTERLKQTHQLIRLTGTVSIPFGMDELRYPAPSFSTTEVLKAIGLR